MCLKADTSELASASAAGTVDLGVRVARCENLKPDDSSTVQRALITFNRKKSVR